MLESIRKHSKYGMFLLFLLVIPSFVLVGIDRNYFSESSPTVARVDGQEIKQSDWDNAHRIESDRIRAQSPAIDAKLLDAPQARYATLERMVRDRVLEVAVQKMHLTASDAKLASALTQIPAIAALKRADGTLDAQAYRALVGAQGLTPEGFEANMRRNLALNAVLGGVMQSAFTTDAQLNQAMDALYQRREIQVARFQAPNFAAKVLPSEEDLQAFYQKHSSRFMQPEQADIEYLVLDLDTVSASVVLSEDDLRTYFKENMERFAGKEERRASHILLNASKDMPAADREKIKEKAQEILAQVRAKPGSFAELAKKYSQDTGSAPSGGDLGFFTKGAMVKPFEDAAFALKKEEISAVVETDFGYHIIALTEVKTPPQPRFEQVRAKLEKDVRQEQAQRKFAEVAEAFTNGVYEQSEQLQATADKLKLPVQTAQHITRMPTPGTQGVLGHERFLQALFATESIENKRNTEAIEVGPQMLASGRIVQYAPARTQSYEEVRADVRTQYIAEKAAELARAEGVGKLGEWKANGAAATGLAPAVIVSREALQKLPRAVVNAALHANTDSLPAWTGVDLGAEGYAIVKINRIAPRDPVDAPLMAAQRQQMEQWLGTAEGMAYYETLKARYKVQIKIPRPQV